MFVYLGFIFLVLRQGLSYNTDGPRACDPLLSLQVLGLQIGMHHHTWVRKEFENLPHLTILGSLRVMCETLQEYSSLSLGVKAACTRR